MPRDIRWTRTLGAKLAGISLILSAVALLLLVVNPYLVAAIQSENATLSVFLKGRYLTYQMLSLAFRLSGEKGADRGEVQKSLKEAIAAMDQRYEDLLAGNVAEGLRGVAEPEIRARISERRQTWKQLRSETLVLA